MADDDSKVAEIRAQMPATESATYLNTGTFGPLPRVAIDAMADCQRTELERGRIGADTWARSGEIKDRARAAVARLFGAPVDNVALTRHTTDGMNIAINGLNWRPGDEIVITDMEHPGAQLPVYNVARRYGVAVRLARLGDGTGDVVGAIEESISPRTRMVVISHLTWNTGTVLPIAEVAAMAHRHHALVTVDAAQSAGSIPLDLPATGVDVYGGPGQKWLCGPEGTGEVYVSDAALDVVQPTVVGYASMGPGMEHQGGYFLPAHGARRFEVGGMNAPQVAGQAASLEFLLDTVGLDWAHARIARLGQYAFEQLAALDGIAMLTPKNQMAGIVSFALDGIEPPDLTTALGERGVLIRHLHGPDGNRVSTGYYNTEQDVDRLIDAIREIRAA